MFDYRTLYEIQLSVSVDFLRVVQFLLKLINIQVCQISGMPIKMYKLYSKIPGKLTRNIINYNWIRTKRWVRNVLSFGSETSQARVRIVLGPKSIKCTKGLGSESSGYLRSSVPPSIRSFVRPSLRPSVRPSIHPFIHPCRFIHSYISLIFIRLFICLVSLDLIKTFLCFEITTEKNMLFMLLFLCL